MARKARSTMPLRALACPRCGASLPPNVARGVVVCAYCHASVTSDGETVRAADFRAAARALDDAASPGRVEVARVPYRVLGRIARGEATDVLLATRDRAVTERVVLKVLRDPRDRDLLDHTWDALGALHAAGAWPGGRLPAIVARGTLAGAATLVLRPISGFVHTLDDVRAHYPRGVDARAAVWIWRRLLETLVMVHSRGWAHGAVLPQHVLLHARDHGAMLVGWSCAERLDDKAPLRALLPSRRAFYPDAVMAARCVTYALGADDVRVVPPGLPAALAAVLTQCARRAATRRRRARPSTDGGGRGVRGLRPAGVPSVSDARLALPAPHNAHGRWQGAFRRGWPDLVLAHYARAACGEIDALALTHLDALGRGPAWQIACAYRASGASSAPVERADAAVVRLRASPTHDLAHQARLAELLAAAEPVYEPVRDARELSDRLATATGARVVLGAYGPRSTDVCDAAAIH